jgi:predicted DNA-binding transcriptional regulator AlpA
MQSLSADQITSLLVSLQAVLNRYQGYAIRGLSLPDQIIREADLKKYDGLGHAWRWECMERGTYPPPIKLSEGGRFKAWLASEISAWQRWRTARRDGTAGPDSSWKDFLEVGAMPSSAAASPPAAKPRTR